MHTVGRKHESANRPRLQHLLHDLLLHTGNSQPLLSVVDSGCGLDKPHNSTIFTQNYIL